jgi:excinuclease UvrABC nuclease subunit
MSLLSPFPKASVPPVVVAGITFGKYRFCEPRSFPTILIPPIQGVYALMVQDSGWTPRKLRPIYIGESADLKKRLTPQHEKYDHWKREAAGLALYYAYHMTIGATEKQRKDMEAELIGQYNPPCNTLLLSMVRPLMPLKRIG